MDLLNLVFFTVSLCSMVIQYTHAVAVCEDKDPSCPGILKFCIYAGTKERCPLTCKQCQNVSPSPATSLSSSSTTSSSLMSIASSSSLAPTQSAAVVSRPSAHLHDQNGGWKNNQTTISGTASTTNFIQANTLILVGILWSYFFSCW